MQPQSTITVSPRSRRRSPGTVWGLAAFGPEATRTENETPSAPASCRNCSIRQASSASVWPTKSPSSTKRSNAMSAICGRPADRIQLALVLDRAQLFDEAVAGNRVDSARVQARVALVGERGALEPDAAGEELREGLVQVALRLDELGALDGSSALRVPEVGEQPGRARARRAGPRSSSRARRGSACSPGRRRAAAPRASPAVGRRGRSRALREERQRFPVALRPAPEDRARPQGRRSRRSGATPPVPPGWRGGPRRAGPGRARARPGSRSCSASRRPGSRPCPRPSRARRGTSRRTRPRCSSAGTGRCSRAPRPSLRSAARARGGRALRRARDRGARGRRG